MRIGIDLGGTKLEAIALSENGETLMRRRIPSPKDDYGATVATIVSLVQQIERQTQQQGSVGVGIPGAISPVTGLIKNANSTWLIGKPFNRDLQDALERPVRMTNDANCFAVSEATDGAAQGSKIVFAVIIGTGTGGGIALDRQPLIGRNAIGGEWGHNPLPWPSADEGNGSLCYCGKHGCIETYLSGPGFTRDHHEHGGKEDSPIEIVQLAEQGEVIAMASLQRYEDRLARSLATIINILDPDIIVLGGGMSNIQRIYTNVPKLLPNYVFSDKVTTPVVPPKHGDSSGVRGAAWLWPDN